MNHKLNRLIRKDYDSVIGLSKRFRWQSYLGYEPALVHFTSIYWERAAYWFVSYGKYYNQRSVNTGISSKQLSMKHKQGEFVYKHEQL